MLKLNNANHIFGKNDPLNLVGFLGTEESKASDLKQ